MNDHSRRPSAVKGDIESQSEGHFLVESGVNNDANAYVRAFFDGNKVVMDSETGWTVVRLLTEALGAAEGDALVYKWAKANLDEEAAARMLIAMREQRELRDVSARHKHFYERIRE